MIKEVNLKGLSCSPSDHASADGELGTCLNLINEDGTLKPIFPAVETGDSIPDKHTIEFVHKVTHDQETHSHYILKFTQANVSTWAWMEMSTEDNMSNGILNKIDISNFSVNAVTAIGNVLCFVGEDRTLYAFWKTDKYVVLDLSQISYTASTIQENNKYSLRPETSSQPSTFSFSQDYVQTFEGNLETYTFSSTTRLSKDISSDNLQNIFASVDATVRKSMNDETFTYIQACVMALRLYDGTYILIGKPFFTYSLFDYTSSSSVSYKSKIRSSVYIANPINYNASFKDGYNTKLTLEKGKIYIFSLGQRIYKLGIKFHTVLGGEYKEIIDSIDVFITPPIYPFNTRSASVQTEDFDKVSFNLSEYGRIIWEAIRKKVPANLAIEFPPLTNKEIYSKIDESVFYKSVSIPYDELDTVTTYKLKRVYGTEETLSLADMKRQIIGADHAITYNNRLHLANVHYHLNNSNAGSIYLGTELDNKMLTDITYNANGETIRQISYEDVPERIPSLISFPHTNVIHACIYVKSSEGYFRLTIPMHKSGNFGLSYWVNFSSDGEVMELETSSMEVSSEGEWDKVYNAYKSQSNTPIHYPSVIRVSEAENPFVFSASDSVTVGSAQIKALGTNTRPISEGQFGDAPLYAFTDEGVWMVMLGSEGTYQARQPINREILSNSKSVLPIDDAIVYATDRGLILQEGANAVCISDALDDYPFDFTQLYSETFANKVLAAGNTDAELVRYVRFREFLKDAQMMYDYYDSRIIVFNDAYAYAYVYSLKSKMWGTMANTFKTCVNAYPNTYAVDKTAYIDETSKKRFNIVNVYNENPTADTPYFLCTRPFSLDAPDIHKTMFSTIARGYFRNADKGKCGMVLYGSNDLFHWHPIGSSVNRYLRGLAGSPYKYFRLALTGSLSVDESITGFSADYIERWQNRLR